VGERVRGRKCEGEKVSLKEGQRDKGIEGQREGERVKKR
jgi:hypothetical protein